MENLDNLLLALFCFFMGAAVVGGVVYWRMGSLTRPPASSGKILDPDLVEVAQLWRSRKTNRLLVELEEQTHHSASELSVTQQQHLSNAAAVLLAWLAEAEPSEASLPQPVVASRSLPPSPSSGTAQPWAAPVSPPQDLKPVPPRPLEAFGRVISSNPAQAAPQFKSIVAQINEILQARLPGSPFETFGLTLTEDPNQGVIVQVGSDQYSGVDAIPDPAVRAFVKAAVAEWEAKVRSRQPMR